ncbi:MAG TPA: SMI1/KNR4 family protein [Actinomycetes bacterium]|nr:SMI1/KNR4 family protein [Actinomycetes bacterium]
MDEIESVMHELGAAFAAGLTQPGSMQAVLWDRGRRGQTYDAAGDPARIGRCSDTVDAGLFALRERVKSHEGLQGVFVVEVTATGSGDYVVSYSADLPSLPPRVVFDDGYRYPNHPKPGMRKPPAGVNDGRPTDPAMLAQVQALVTEFVQQHTRLRGAPPQFTPGYSEAEIFAVEERLGVRLPEDLRALYRTIHDDNRESGLLGRFSPAPLEQVVTWYHEGDPGSPRWYGSDDELLWDVGLFEYDPVVFETHPYGHVRRLSRNDWWVTFAPDHGGNEAAVDLDPAALGAYGQLLMYGRDVYGPIVYLAASVRHCMRTVLAAMRGALPGDEQWHAVGWSTPDHQWLVDIGDAVLVDEVAAVPDASVIQLAHLRQVQQVRLAGLAGLPHLRCIRIIDVRQKAEYVDLSIPPGLPVEQVHIQARRFEPPRLAATPTLAYVTLAGNTEPVAVAALAGLPNLVRLDLADAAVADVGAIAAFPALRVLSLNAHQWDELLRTGWTPSRLAAAELGGRASVAEAAAWLPAIRGTGHPGVRYRTVRGRR